MPERGSWGGGALSSNVFRCTIQWVAQNQKCSTGFHLRDVGLSGESVGDIADAVGAFASTQFRKLLWSADSLVGVDVVNMQSKEGAAVSFTNINGALTGKGLPTFLQCPVALKSGYRMRQASGRMLWPVRTEGVIDNQELNALGKTTFNEVIADLTSRFTGPDITTNLRLVHVHDDIKDAGGVVIHPKQWYDIDSLRVNTLVSGIRRRKVGVGS